MSLIITVQSYTHVSLHVYIPLYTQDCSSLAMLFLVVSMYTVLVHSNLHSPKHNAHHPHDQLKITTKPGKQFLGKNEAASCYIDFALFGHAPFVHSSCSSVVSYTTRRSFCRVRQVCDETAVPVDSYTAWIGWVE